MPKKSKLTEKQKAFTEEYLKDLNGKEAAMRAGYTETSAKQIAYHLKKDPEVASEINQKMSERSERTGITADYVLTTIKSVVERCLQAEPVMQWDPIAKEMAPTGEFQFDASNALKGADLLGKHLKLWNGDNDVNVTVNVGKLSDAELEAAIRAKLSVNDPG